MVEKIEVEKGLQRYVGEGFCLTASGCRGRKKGIAILDGEKRKPVSKRYKVSVLIKLESGRRTQLTETERERGGDRGRD